MPISLHRFAMSLVPIRAALAYWRRACAEDARHAAARDPWADSPLQKYASGMEPIALYAAATALLREGIAALTRDGDPEAWDALDLPCYMQTRSDPAAARAALIADYTERPAYGLSRLAGAWIQARAQALCEDSTGAEEAITACTHLALLSPLPEDRDPARVRDVVDYVCHAAGITRATAHAWATAHADPDVVAALAD